MNPDSPDEVEILQMEALLRSMDVFGSEPSSPAADLLESAPKSTSEAVAKANKINKKEPSSCYIHGRGNGTFKANGSLNSNVSRDSFDSFVGQGDFQNKICSGSRGPDGHFNRDASLGFKQKLSKCNGEWADRDSGVEEGRICDFEFEFSQEKSMSQDSLSHITGSFLSLELDLGPSILDDVLDIMDRPPARSRPRAAPRPEDGNY